MATRVRCAGEVVKLGTSSPLTRTQRDLTARAGVAARASAHRPALRLRKMRTGESGDYSIRVVEQHADSTASRVIAFSTSVPESLSDEA